ncbi:hypothetical protein J437_LFUL000391 [Ladona fulva]|uniref:X-box-binding protein 1 n=1 Tax=Ladona fulva TaxID=123851 RepID=A0A8K0K7J4_LADFU|nr:hypothetical protein J437_LFUL000391 [Ladona fulva]
MKMESPQMIIIRVPELGLSSEVPTTSPVYTETEMKLLGLSKPGVTVKGGFYPKCSKNRPNLDDIVTELSPGRRKVTFPTDDKHLRKKLKNRVAAQNSRDKKKARMEELEKLVKELQTKNDTVMQECQRLKTEVSSLKEENSQLKQKLSCYCENAISASPIEPAAFINDPLPKGQGISLVTFLLLLSFAVKMKQTNSCCKSNGWLKESLKKGLYNQPEETKNFLQILICQPLIEDSTSLLNADEMVGAAAKDMESGGWVILNPRNCISSQSLPSSNELGLLKNENAVQVSKISSEIPDIIEQSINDLDLKNENIMDCSNDSALTTELISDIAVESIDFDSLSDTGYESLDSPVSDLSASDQSNWDESFSVLFPSLL